MYSQKMVSFVVLSMLFFQPFVMLRFESSIENHNPKVIVQKSEKKRKNRFNIGTESRTVKEFDTDQPYSKEILVKYKENVKTERITQLNKRIGSSPISTHAFGIKKLRVPEGKSAPQLAKDYEQSPLVQYAEPNYIFHTLMEPNDPYYKYQWHMQEREQGGINVAPAWDISTGSDTKIAVIDTGIRRGPDLQDTDIINGRDFYNNDDNATDDNGHGTHVAGTIAQSTNNSVGVVGIAFDATLLAVKALNSTGYGTLAMIADGIEWAVDNGTDIINLSLGGDSGSQILEDAVEYAYNKNVTVVAASGNGGEMGMNYPAAYDDYVIAVGATQYDKSRAPYSNYGPSLDVVAPGGNLQLDQNDDEYADGVLQQTFNATTGDWYYPFYQGTSMATPHVTGVAALYHSKENATPDEIRTVLENASTDLGVDGKDMYYGHGLISARQVFGKYLSPSVVIDHPQNTTYSTTQVDINVTVWDSYPSIANVTAEINSTNTLSLVHSQGNQYYNNTYEFSEGTYTIRIFAKDTQGHVNSQKTITFTISKGEEPTNERSFLLSLLVIAFLVLVLLGIILIIKK